MKVLIINYRFFHTGGPERYMFNLIAALEARGHEVIPFSAVHPRNERTVYTRYFAKPLDASDSFLYNDSKKSIRHITKRLAREFYSISVRRSLRKLIQATRPDVCYLLPHKIPLSASILDACRKVGLPVVHRVSDLSLLCDQGGLYRKRRFCDACRSGRWQSVRSRCVKSSFVLSLIRYLAGSLHRRLQLYKAVDRFVLTNKFAEQQFLNFGFDHDALVTIQTFGATKTQRAIGTNFSGRAVRFVCIGNVDDTKGTPDLLDAIELLKPDFDSTTFQLTIVGGIHESERERTRGLIALKGLSDRVTMTAPVPMAELAQIYQRADVSILPSRWVENLPNVQIESLSFGIPIVAPRLGSFAATLTDEVAFFFEPYKPSSLAETLRRILRDPSSITTKSKACIPFAEEHFGEEQHVTALCSLFKEVIIAHH
jgi:glycosyltransferase involved in cell wall biosynthesis